MHDVPALLIENVRALEPGRGIAGSSVLIDGGRIIAIDPVERPSTVQRFDGNGRLLTPGLIDLHTHGIEAFAFERSADDLRQGLERLPRYGVTCCLPTLYRVMQRNALGRLEQLADAARSVPVAAGLHLEGPFLALAGAGAATEAGDVGFARELLAAAGGQVKAMSVSPDTAGIVPVIEYLVEQGVVVFLTHTRATAEQTDAAIAAGARHATHFYDVFPMPPETEPGVRPAGAVEAILADRRVSVDFIADGVHVHPAAIRAALAAKGWKGVIAITDANVGAGLGAGVHPTAWGYDVSIRPGDAARIHRPGAADHGLLAGSALTLDRAMSNLLAWLRPHLEPAQTWAMATRNPARLMAIDRKGSLLPGSDADLVLWDEGESAVAVTHTWLAGALVFAAPST